MHYAIHIIVVWLVSALALWITARLVPGMDVAGFSAALLATIVITLVDHLLGPILRFLAFPITFLTLGLFRLIINAVLLKIAALFSPGFRINGFLPAILGSIVLTVVGYILRLMVA